MLYTVAEVSEILEVSKVTVYNKLNSLKNELKPYTRHKKGILHIDDKGLLIMKESLGLNEVKTALKSEDDLKAEDVEKQEYVKQFKDADYLIKTIKKTIETGQENYIKSLLKQIELLESEIGKKDDQINKLLQLQENSQVLLKQEKEKVLMIQENETQNKKSFFDLFKKK